MNREEMAALMRRVFDEEINALREAGQREYAHDADNAFANFERRAAELGVSPMLVLLVYAGKHWDGIHAWAKGHRSQREDVTGRINDLIVYLFLLRGMIEQERGRRDPLPALNNPPLVIHANRDDALTFALCGALAEEGAVIIRGRGPQVTCAACLEWTPESA